MSENFLTGTHANFHDPDVKLCDSKKKSPTRAEISELIFYESIISLESLLFLIEIDNMSEKDIDEVFVDIVDPSVRTMFSKKLIGDCVNDNKMNGSNPIGEISTKREILDLLDVYMNFSQKIDTSSSLNEALKKRNSFFEKDKSQIAKHLYINKLRNLRDTVSKLEQKDLHEIIDIKHIKAKNDKYQRMVKALRKAIIETENLTKAVERERREFIRDFKTREYIQENNDLFEVKIAFNLGGSIFAPNIFMQLVKDILTEKKDDLIEKVVKAVLMPIEKLELFIRHKSNTEKKEEILKFLLACLEKRNNSFFDLIDEAFKMRSVIINLYVTSNENVHPKSFIDKIDKHQESYIKDMINKIKKAKEDSLEKFLVLNRDIIATYKSALQIESKTSKVALLDLFRAK